MKLYIVIGLKKVFFFAGDALTSNFFIQVLAACVLHLVRLHMLHHNESARLHCTHTHNFAHQYVHYVMEKKA